MSSQDRSPDTLLAERVARHLTDHLDATPAPPADLDAVRRRGRAARGRRRVSSLVAVAAVGLGAAALVATAPWQDDPAGRPDGPDLAIGALDLSGGLRAYGSPDGRLSLGGRTVDLEQAEDLDTDAAATAYGVVFFDRGRPHLLGEDGTAEPLVAGLPAAPRDFHPTAKTDAVEPRVAWVVMEDGDARLQVYDLERREVVASDEVPCGEEDCSDVVVDGIDSGVVFVRNAEATWVWSIEERTFTELAGPATRVADVRNRVLLYDGPRPTLPLSAWRYVAGAVDAQLTFDGRHVLDWSATLQPTGGGRPVVLDVPRDVIFFTFDTDGSVLAATTGSPARFYDCVVPSGRCEQIGEMEMVGGDPLFMGNDM
ncbi:hypothetical protein [Nocardioides caldifontis]|uniref:hypothetical protein n=1 Tax=Nocardioides caldifontis TaxID=2588938 RepID=UPI0011E05DFA|nr:hypothetical protein [Nocardioides caldifontis]